MPEDLELQQKVGRLDDVERQLATFVDTIPTLAWMADGDGWIFWYNQRWYEYTGTSPEQMQGWGWKDVHDPAALPRVMARWTESIYSGEPFEMVFPLRGADGVFRSFMTRIVPVKDASGKIIRWFGTNAEVDELLRTRDALASSEMQFRQIAEGLPNLVWMTRADGYVEWFNGRWYDFTGATPEQSLGHAWGAFFHPSDVERTRRRWEHSLSTGEPYEIEYRCRRRDGEYRWFLGSALPLRDADGTIVHWFGTCTDIDQRKVAEQERTRAEERMQVALSSVPLILYTIDSELRYTWMHRPHREFNMAEMIGTTDAEIAPDGTLQDLIVFKQSVIDRGLPERRELRLTVKGVPEVYDVAMVPAFDHTGKVTGATVAALDVTERAIVEQDLREKSELIDLVQSAVGAGYWLYYPSSGVCFLSPGEQALFGIGSARPLVKEIFDLIHADDRERVEKSLRDGLESGAYFAEFRVSQASGGYKWIAATGSTLTTPAGEKYLVGINIDVSERKQVEETLIQSEKLAVVGRLASSIAHEINNPLESVTNLLYLARGSDDPDAVREYLEVAEREVRRVSAIANQTLRFHKQPTHATSVHVQTLIEDALSIYQGRLANSSIRIEKRRRATRPVTCFEGEIRQVLANLIGNAMDALGADGGRILLRTRDATDRSSGRKGVVITVADSGGGIPRDARGKIFAPFFTTKGMSGTGLGLWVSSEIALRHEGRLRFRSSQRPGCSGTVFDLFLPLIAAQR